MVKICSVAMEQVKDVQAHVNRNVLREGGSAVVIYLADAEGKSHVCDGISVASFEL